MVENAFYLIASVVRTHVEHRLLSSCELIHKQQDSLTKPTEETDLQFVIDYLRFYIEEGTKLYKYVYDINTCLTANDIFEGLPATVNCFS